MTQATDNINSHQVQFKITNVNIEESLSLGLGIKMTETKKLLQKIIYLLDKCSPYETAPVMQVLYKYSLRKLHDLIRNITEKGKYEIRAEREDHFKLFNFLSEFHALVKDTDALPLHIPNSDLSQIMFQVAIMLESFFPGYDRYKLLMPTLMFKPLSLNLASFIMSDDNTRLIDVLQTLQFAEKNGQLKDVFNLTHSLSSSEQQRVINHSAEAYNYWHAICNHYNKIPQNANALLDAQISLLVAMASPTYQVTATYFGNRRPSLLFEKLSQLSDLLEFVGRHTIKDMDRQNINYGGCRISKRRKGIHDAEEQNPNPKRKRRWDVN
jgi:hypothetical protein